MQHTFIRLSDQENILSKEFALHIDRKSFEELYNVYAKMIFRMCYRSLGDQEEASNIVHNIFLHVWEHRETLVLEKAEHYFLRAAKMQIMKYYRDKASRQTHLNKVLDDYTDADFSTEEVVLYRELRGNVDSLVEQLPGQQRKVYKMRDMEGKTARQIAHELKISISAVKQHITKATFFLRAHLQK